ncbi:MAG: hypothetical protein K8R13_10255, partial [Methanococcoides sp.]|nr:hypothetical protein [Methanococcoides sp.]
NSGASHIRPIIESVISGRRESKMEYVTVKYYRKRNVFMDGNSTGKTNETLRVEEGTHKFDLGEPKNYSPGFRKTKVMNTTQIKPMEITFSPVKEAP